MAARAKHPREGLWVFGYGSLVWEPGFGFSDRRIARLHGWHRSFCMRSVHHRGTAENPGLVLALDRADGAWCDGVAFRARDGEEAAALSYLRERELISSAYLEERHEVVFREDGDDGRAAREAVVFVIDRAHPQYCGGLPLEDQARIILGATGGRGRNRDYLWMTAAHLAELGLADPDLDWLAERVRALEAAEGRPL